MGTPLPLLRVAAVHLREIRMPLVEPFRISSGLVRDRRILLLQLRHPDGPVAWSECVAGERPNYSPETVDTVRHAIREWLAPRVLGQELRGPQEAAERMDEGVRGHRMAKAALEMGLWGLAAELADQPLAALLGGVRRKVGTGISLGIQDSPEALVERARREHARGYQKIKIKIQPGADLEYVEAVRAALPDAELMADANSAYTLDDADHLRRLDELDLMMIEQPLDREDLVQHARLQQTLRTPLCLDESITCLDRAQDMVSLGSGRIVNIKPGRVGGLTASLAIHDFCGVHGVPVWCGGMLETGVGRAYNVALASLPNFTLPGDLSPSDRYWERDVVRPAWTMDEGGMVRVPLDEPGLGVEVDVDRIDDLTVDLHVVEPAGGMAGKW